MKWCRDESEDTGRVKLDRSQKKKKKKSGRRRRKKKTKERKKIVKY